MNLVVDIGNTRVKSALFKQKNLNHLFVFDTVKDFQNNFEKLLQQHPVKQIIVSNVANTELDTFLKSKFTKVFTVSVNLKLPFLIEYETPHLLGQDRIAAVAGALSEFSGNLLIIDFGTCIKYNVVIDKTFKGGAISPGLQMRYNALHHFTGKLPLLNFTETNKLPDIVGKNTFENLHSGVINGCIAEVNYFIDEIEKKFGEEFKIIATGGNANFFEKLLKRKVFLRPYLILNGLNEILDYQQI